MATLLPDAGNVVIENVKEDGAGIVVQARSCQTKVACPKCGSVAKRVHSRYIRQIRDIGWLGHPSRLVLVMRKFFCDVDECPLRIFAEQLPRIVVRYARRTVRLTERLRALGLSLGGNQAVAVSRKLDRFPASRRTILRLVRSTPHPEKPTPTRLGVDDFAFRRGHRYGTILIDLDRHEPVDLLPDRLSETLASWLKDHPGIEIISRDRAGAYAEGVRLGAPAAIQVADRWHLLKNLGDALERFLARRHASLAVAGKAIPVQANIEPKQMKETRQTVDRKVRRERRLGIYEKVVGLHKEGFGIREISRNLGMSRATVRKYIRSGCFPEIAACASHSRLNAFHSEMERLWNDGRHTATAIWRELQTRGLRMSQANVVRYCRINFGGRRRIPCETRGRSPSPRKAMWLLIGEKLTEEDLKLRQAILEADAAIVQAVKLAHEFQALVRERNRAGLADWLAKAKVSGFADFVGFAKGIEMDLTAVGNALSLEWSNGQVEGQVNRLKLIKRQMYGRAKFDLLKLRVLLG